MSHDVFMKQAINLGKKGKWNTAPNPCVGAVLVYKGNVVAEGYHTEYGKPHAEIECLLDAIDKGVFLGNTVNFSHPTLACANNVRNAGKKNNDINNDSNRYILTECILYVTLEPCNHQGKTPPCTQAIIESGIKHIVVGVLDPNPKASGGIKKLESLNIHVETGILENECRELIDDFLVWQTKHRPYVILKMATSLDGRIGPKYGDNYRISGVESRTILMQLRENIANAGGAILVGGNTFIKDNPRLTARTETAKKQPYAVVVSSQLPVLPSSVETGFACIDERADKTLFYCSLAQSISPTAFALKKKGVSIQGISHNSNNKGINLKETLEHLYLDKNCPYVLCEGGPHLGLSLLKDGLVDELIFYMAPIVMGDDTSKPVFSGHTIDQMTDTIRFNMKETKLVGSDLHIHLKPELICLQD